MAPSASAAPTSVSDPTSGAQRATNIDGLCCECRRDTAIADCDNKCGGMCKPCYANVHMRGIATNHEQTDYPLPQNWLNKNYTFWQLPWFLFDFNKELFAFPLMRKMTACLVTLLCLMLCGKSGAIPLLTLVWPAFRPFQLRPPNSFVLVPFEQEWLAFAIQAVILIGVPLLIGRIFYRHTPADYGLHLPPKEQAWFAWGAALFLLVPVAATFALGPWMADMQATYPLYRGEFKDAGEFVLYEFGYFVFFVNIEFIWRGFLLTELRLPNRNERPPVLEAVMFQMLTYCTWHISKPQGEMWTTILWGLIASPIIIRSQSIWPITIIHWMFNFMSDTLIIYVALPGGIIWPKP